MTAIPFNEQFGANTNHACRQYRCVACPCMDPRHYAWAIRIPDVAQTEATGYTTQTNPETGSEEPISTPGTVSNFRWTSPLKQQNEIQLLYVWGGSPSDTFTLQAYNETTAPLPITATAAQVESAFKALRAFGPQDISCTGGPLPFSITQSPTSGSNAIWIQFDGQYARTDVPEIVVNNGANHLPGGLNWFVEEYRRGVDVAYEMRWDETFHLRPGHAGNRCGFFTGMQTPDSGTLPTYIDAWLTWEPDSVDTTAEFFQVDGHPDPLKKQTPTAGHWWAVFQETKAEILDELLTYQFAWHYFLGPHRWMFNCRGENVFLHYRTDVLDRHTISPLHSVTSYYDLGFSATIERVPIRTQTIWSLGPFGETIVQA